MALWWRLSAALVLAATAAQAAPETRSQFVAHICSQVESEAKANGLEPEFFARLLWRESLFDPTVTSAKGAQGIAQFMPETATQRGLADPYAPEAAIKASAAYLSELKIKFGNSGLAAAAYNAGEDRIARWLGGKSSLPFETISYVAVITGHEAEEWKKPEANFPTPELGKAISFTDNCIGLASQEQTVTGLHIASAAPAPWGAVLAVNFNESVAVAQFRRLKLRFPSTLANRDPLIQRKRNLSRGIRRLVYVMLGEKGFSEAQATCTTLHANGASCLVLKN